MRLPVAPLLPLLLISCGEKTAPDPAPAEAAESASDPVAEAVLASMDMTADPCQDFYQYACGGWLAETTLPADKPIWSRSFSVINEQNRVFLKDLLDRAAADPSSGDEDWARIGELYGSCLDEEAVEAGGTAALEPWLEAISAIDSPEAFMTTAGSLEKVGVSVMAGVWVDGDFTDPQLSIMHLSQAGLALPDRDYYLKDDDDSVKLLTEYEAYVAEVLGLLGIEGDMAARAKAVVDLEKAIAEVHMPAAELRDPEKTYHKIDREGLVALEGGLPWAAWLAAADADGITDINASTPEPFKGQAAVIAGRLDKDPEAVRDWLRMHLVKSTAPHLPAAFYDASFGFFNAKVYGQQEPEPRWKRCVDLTNGTLGEVVGRFYVEERFGGDSKDIAVEMIEGIQDAFEAGLPALEWMDDPTREAAVEKKSLLTNKIGYPDVWRDYSALDIEDGAHLANVLASRQFEHAYYVDMVGKPVDKNQWFMAPSQVNAYYHPIRAEMVFPAGIMQPPFFDADFPRAMNYGGIGMVMGHELTHGFDDSGRKFDGTGRMVEWWPEEVSAGFEERAQCVDDFYSNYEVAPELKVNGKLTLGENIADIGGLREAYRAYKAWEAVSGGEPARVAGLNNDQLLFVSFAQGWCTVSSPEFEKMMVLSNSHSPSKFRVTGPASHLPEFHEAFSCEAGDAMVAEKIREVLVVQET